MQMRCAPCPCIALALADLLNNGLIVKGCKCSKMVSKSRDIVDLVIRAQILRAGSLWGQVISVIPLRMACSPVYMVDNPLFMYS